jgi:hypothetical protein
MVSLSAPVCFCAKVHWRSRPFCVVDEVVQDLRPLDAGLDLEVALLRVERDHLRHAPHVDQQAVAEELLAAHGVARAADRDRVLFLLRRLDRAADAVERVGLHDAPHRAPS